jgi:3-methyladenine DNA glycosylase/8-oxoguanine DNA glycosylase
MPVLPRVDPGPATRHLKKASPELARVIAAVGPCTLTIPTRGSLFAALVRSIIYQQLAGAAAATIHRRLMAIYGGKSPTAQQVMATDDATLRQAGLSGQKLGYLRDLAGRTLAEEIDFRRIHRLPDHEVIADLTRVKGIGEWTVQMLLMFRLGRADVLPAADLGIRKGVQRAFGLRELPAPRRVLELGAPWAPHRTVASWYLWRSLD